MANASQFGSDQGLPGLLVQNNRVALEPSGDL
jgi:hypothetical protein